MSLLSGIPPVELTFLLAISFILGTCLGSFVGVLIARIPNFESIRGRSRCDSCRAKILALSNVPILSYVIQRGRCITCNSPIDPLNVRLEILGGLLIFLPLFLADEISWILGIEVFLYLGLALAIIDWKTKKLPQTLTISLLGFELIVLAARALNSHDWNLLLRGAIITFAIFAVFGAIHLVTPRGFALGDVKFATGFAPIFSSFSGVTIYLGYLMSFVFATIYAVYRILYHGEGRKAEIPFGPFIYIGGIATLLIGAFFS